MISLTLLLEQAGIAFSGTSIEISGLNTLGDANANELSFLQNKSYLRQLSETKAGAILVSEDVADKVPDGCIAVVVEEPYLALAKLSSAFKPKLIDTEAPEAVIGAGTVIAKGANVERGAVIGKNCTILGGAYIGRGAVIGNNTIIHANATIYHDCKVGSDCIVHSSAVVGSDGFGFATTKLGTHVKIHQNGNVIVEDDVEIGASSTVDRAAFGTTWIKTGVRIDNLVQVGHNAIIGEYSVLVSQSGVAGSTELGRNVVFGGQTAAAGHLKIAPFTTFAARSGITHDVKESNKVYGGFPLMEQRQWLRLQAKIARLLKK